MSSSDVTPTCCTSPFVIAIIHLFFFHLVDIYTQQRILKGYSFVPSDQLLELVLESLWALHSVKLTLDCIFEDLAVLQASPR